MGAKATQPGSEQPYDGLLRREIDVEFRSLNEDERSFEVVASSETLDSHGDVLRQFWDLSRYEKNGCVLWNHNQQSYLGADPEDTLPIGRAEARVESKKLVAKIWLLKGEAETEPLVDKIWRRVQQDVIKAVSVGFRPGQVTRKVNAAGETDFYELGSKDRPNELREISLVPMGSNPDAVAKSIASERTHLAKLLTQNSEVRTAASEPTAVSGKEDNIMNEEQFKAALAKVEASLAEANAAKGASDQKATAAETRATSAETRIKTLETDLTAEKAISTKLTSELDAERVESKKLKTELSKSALDSLQGVKFAPAEREELDGLVESVGIDRVKSLLAKRTDIVLTQPVLADGKPVEAKGAPATVSADPSADLVATANKNIAAA